MGGDWIFDANYVKRGLCYFDTFSIRLDWVFDANYVTNTSAIRPPFYDSMHCFQTGGLFVLVYKQFVVKTFPSCIFLKPNKNSKHSSVRAKVWVVERDVDRQRQVWHSSIRETHNSIIIIIIIIINTIVIIDHQSNH